MVRFHRGSLLSTSLGGAPLHSPSRCARAAAAARPLASGARLRPQALLHFARWGPLYIPRLAARSRSALRADFPPALACGRRRFATSLGGAPLHSPPRCALAVGA